MRIIVMLAALVLTLLSLFALIWSVVPAPTYRLFMLSIAASEWSLPFGAVALIGVVLGMVAWRLGSSVGGCLAIVCGLIAVGLALKPPVQAQVLAAQERIPLSLGRYVLGVTEPRITTTRDVVYATVDGSQLRLDVYEGTTRDVGLSPAVVVVHGGSWSGGDKGEFAAMSRTLAAQSMVVFDVQYRLASAAHPFPAQIADVRCAIGWVKANAERFRVDPGRVAVLGRSAGGQVALLAAYAPDDPALPSSCAVGDTSVQAVVSFYAPVDLAWGYDHVLQPDVVRARPALERYLQGTPTSRADAYRLASPITHIKATTPPTLIIHGGFDRFVSVEHARFLDAALSEAEVDHRLIVVPWANHGFDFAANGWGAQISERAILDFLQTHLC